jgi:transposase
MNKPTITNISDELWNIISSTLLTEKPNKTIDRPIIPYRKVFNGIVYVLRTGCPVVEDVATFRIWFRFNMP